MKTPLENQSLLQNLTFPLNVYANLVSAESGEPAYLGFGLQVGDGDISSAQIRLADRLVDGLASPPPASVLDVGCGTGEMARRLAAMGYKVTALEHNLAAVSLAQRHCSDTADLTIIQSRFEDFAGSGQFDLILMQNSFQYMLPMHVFARALHLLKPGGQLLIAEEFTRDDSPIADEPLPVLASVRRLAQRVGFTEASLSDLSTEATAFLARLLTLLEHRLPQLPELTGLPAQRLRDLQQALKAQLSSCKHGRRGHFLLDLRLAQDTDATQTLLLPAAELPASTFQALFEKSFATPFDAALWKWKYSAGRGHSVFAQQAGEAVAHYGGISRDILYFGKPYRALQICDVMVLPERRGFFSKKGLFFRTAASMLEQYAGNTRRHLLGFGFPNRKAMHVAQRLGLYEQTDELMAVFCSPHSAPAGNVVLLEVCQQTGLQQECLQQDTIRPGASWRILADSLWQRMQLSYTDAIIGLRDSRYLHYRYVERPGQLYHCLRLEKHGEAVALAFVREHGDQYLLMDIICAQADLPASLQALNEFGNSRQRPLVFWLTAGQLKRLGGTALVVEPTGIRIPSNSWSRGPSADELRGSWWLTAGDMDFL